MNSVNIPDIKTFKYLLKDKNYPKGLAKIKDPPKALYARGLLSEELLTNSIAVVGSRKMTRYGQSVVDMFVSAFVDAGVTIISGFMYGADTAAHEAAIENSGRTVAVLASGLNQIYPQENKELYKNIIQQNGAIVSELDSEEKAKLWTFARRNRIVSGLSTLGVLVVEAGDKSGSLLTSEFALAQGKQVYAVPGQITSSVSMGTNKLIKEGKAQLVTDPSDIIKDHKIKKISRNSDNTSELGSKIMGLLENEEMSIDEMSSALGVDIITLSKELTLMSLQNLVTESGGKYYLV